MMDFEPDASVTVRPGSTGVGRGIHGRHNGAATVTGARSGAHLILASIMEWPAPVAPPEAPVSWVADQLRASELGHVVVVAGRVPIAIACEQDVLSAPGNTRVFDVAHRAPLVTGLVPPDHAAFLLRYARTCSLPVVVSGQRCGVVTRETLAAAGVGGHWPRCAACGSYHRVDEATELCDGCVAFARPLAFDELYVDLGCGD